MDIFSLTEATIVLQGYARARRHRDVSTLLIFPPACCSSRRFSTMKLQSDTSCLISLPLKQNVSIKYTAKFKATAQTNTTFQWLMMPLNTQLKAGPRCVWTILLTCRTTPTFTLTQAMFQQVQEGQGRNPWRQHLPLFNSPWHSTACSTSTPAWNLP